MLDRKIFLDLSKHTDAKVGRKQQDQANNPEIVLGGIGIQSMHANFKTDSNKTVLLPMSDAAMQQCWINGEKLVNNKPV